MEKSESGLGIEPHSVTYWESRQVNIGDYESVSFGGTSVVKFINAREKRAEIYDKETVERYPLMTDEEAFAVAQSKVTQILNAREKTLRLQSNSNGGTSFDTMKKGQDFGVITSDDIGLTEIADTVSDKKKPGADFDEEFANEFEEDAKPITRKSVKKPEPIPSGPDKKKSKFALKPSGLFATTKPPAGMGIDPDESIDL